MEPQHLLYLLADDVASGSLAPTLALIQEALSLVMFGNIDPLPRPPIMPLTVYGNEEKVQIVWNGYHAASRLRKAILDKMITFDVYSFDADQVPAQIRADLMRFAIPGGSTRVIIGVVGGNCAVCISHEGNEPHITLHIL